MPAPTPVTTEIQYVVGQFRKYRAIQKVHMGKLGTDLIENTVVEFDGQTLKLEGKDYIFPEFRGGIKAKWVVPIEDQTSRYKAQPSNIQVRAAVDKSGGKKPDRSAITTVANEETYVESDRMRRIVKADDTESEGRQVGSIRGRMTVSNEQDQNVGSAIASKRNVGVSVSDAPTVTAAKQMMVVSDAGSADDGVPVGKIGSKAVQRVTVSDGAAAARKTRELDETQRKAVLLPSKKGTDIHAAEAENVEQIIDALEPENRAAMVAKDRRAAAEKAALAAGATPEQIKGTKIVSKPQVKPVAPVKAAPAKTAPKAPVKAAAPTKAVPVKAAAPVKAAPAKPIPKPKRPQSVEEVVLAGDEITFENGLKWDKTLQWLLRAKLAADVFEKRGEADFEAIMAIEAPSVQKFARKILADRQAKA